jgi:hypothetical protein
MKTLFYAKNHQDGSVAPEAKLLDANMGILIEHGGKRFTVREDNFGRLVLTSIGGTSLVLKPRSANAALIDSED